MWLLSHFAASIGLIQWLSGEVGCFGKLFSGCKYGTPRSYNVRSSSCTERD